MPEYRLYFLGQDDRIQRALELECEDDDRAVETGGAHLNGQAMELWRGATLVKRFDPDPH